LQVEVVEARIPFMVIELKDTANVVVHDKFQRWRTRHPNAVFLKVHSKKKASVHSTRCRHFGGSGWSAAELAEEVGRPYSLTSKLKVLADDPGALFGWANQRSTVIQFCKDCLREEIVGKSMMKKLARAYQDPETQADRAIFTRTDIGPTEKQTLVNARRGQGQFRTRVMKLEGKCRVTGIRTAKHLHASHIKPWAHSTDAEKLDGNNGLMLAPHLDHLFDKGYISFSNVGQIIVSDRCARGVFGAWGISRSVKVRPFRPAQRPFLAYHRKQVLLR
jgi:HNH endonuclease